MLGISPMPSCSVVPSSAKRATRSPMRRARIVDWPDDGRHEGCIDLERGVNELERDFSVPEGVRHARVHLGDDEAAAGADLLDGRRQDVDLYTERDLASSR